MLQRRDLKGGKPPLLRPLDLPRNLTLCLVGAGIPRLRDATLYHGGCSGRHRSHMRTLMTSSLKNDLAHVMQHRHPTCLTTRGGLKLWSSTCSRRLPPSHGQGSGSSRSCPRGCDQTLSPAGLRHTDKALLLNIDTPEDQYPEIEARMVRNEMDQMLLFGRATDSCSTSLGPELAGMVQVRRVGFRTGKPTASITPAAGHSWSLPVGRRWQRSSLPAFPSGQPTRRCIRDGR